MVNRVDNESSLLQNLIQETLKEQRRRRRWGIFFKLLTLGVISWFIFTLSQAEEEVGLSVTKPHVGLVDVYGPISTSTEANADDIVHGLTTALKSSGSRGVILRLNSPGGSPVQSDYVYQAIQRLKAQYPKKKIIAVCVDICASGAYYMAAAADQIYANPASMVGSIGVLLNGFGFVDTLQKLGIERRLLTSGQSKGFLDPFSPLKASDEAHAQAMLNEVHEQFIAAVKTGRGKRLASSPELFSGNIWTGATAKQLGLIDGFGSTGEVARSQFDTKNIVDYTLKPDYLQRFAQAFGTQMSERLALLLGIDAMTPLQARR